MVQITIATNAERKQVVTDINTPLQTLINNNGIDTTGANIMLNGRTVSAFDLDRTLAQCGVEEGSTAIMSVIVKASAA